MWRWAVAEPVRDPIVVALVLALREIAARRAAEKAERRRRLTVVEGRKEDRTP